MGPPFVSFEENYQNSTIVRLLEPYDGKVLSVYLLSTSKITQDKTVTVTTCPTFEVTVTGVRTI